MVAIIKVNSDNKLTHYDILEALDLPRVFDETLYNLAKQLS